MSGHAVIVGGGLAGAACAWALTRRGWRVTLYEREARPGVHASGRNAGLVRRLERDPAIATLSRRGAELLAAPPADLARAPLYRRTGSLLLARDPAQLEPEVAAARAAGVEVELGPASAHAACGRLAASERLAAWTPADGVADPHEVLSALLSAARAAGAEVRLETPAALEVEAGAVVGVRCGEERLRADLTILAAGPWAAELARAAGGLDLELQSYRRHLFWTGPLEGVDPDQPWVWDLERGFYLRPESAGWLLCACDHEPRPPEDAQPDALAHERLAEKVARVAPELADHPVARYWAGLRSFAPDDCFVVGPDPRRAGLFWATGLGGHGLTTSSALGLHVGELLAGEAAPGAFDPARFTTARATS